MCARLLAWQLPSAPAFSSEALSRGSWLCPSLRRNQTSLCSEEQAEVGLGFFWNSSDDRYFIHWNGDEVLNVAVECDVHFISS